MSKKNKILIFLIDIFLALISIPFFGHFYELIIGRKVSGWIGYHAEYFEGFFMSLSFFVPLFIFIFLTLKKRKYLGLFILFLVLLNLGQWTSLMIYLLTILTSWLLAQIILFFFKKLRKN